MDQGETGWTKNREVEGGSACLRKSAGERKKGSLKKGTDEIPRHWKKEGKKGCIRF